MRSVGVLTVLAILSTPAASALAKKRIRLQDDHVMTLERWLLPAAVADRIEGSGVDCRSVASPVGSRHKLHVGFVRLHLNEKIAIRAGIGMAKEAALPLAPERNGLAGSAGVSWSIWKRDRFTLDVDVTALHASYHDASMNEGVALLMFRGR